MTLHRTQSQQVHRTTLYPGVWKYGLKKKIMTVWTQWGISAHRNWDRWFKEKFQRGKHGALRKPGKSVRAWKCCSNNETGNRTGGARGGEGHSARGTLVAEDPNEPCSHQVYQARGFWERDWSRLLFTTWFKTKTKQKTALKVHRTTNYHLGKTCVLPAAERLHIHIVKLQHSDRAFRVTWLNVWIERTLLIIVGAWAHA